MDKHKAVAALDANARRSSSGYCARYVRLALEAGGLDCAARPEFGKDYGPFLIRLGFEKLLTEEYVPQAADVAVLQAYPGGDPSGHVEMFDGEVWVSDFKQRDIWAGPGYRKAKPQLDVFRFE